MADVDGGLIAGVVVAIVFVITIALCCVFCNCIVVPQSTGCVVERMGSFRAVLSNGYHFTMPFIDKAKKFTWIRPNLDGRGNLILTTVTDKIIDCREDLFAFQNVQSWTRDTVAVRVNALMLFSIRDVRRALYEVDQLQQAIANTAQAQINEVISTLTFTQVLTAQNYINEHLIKRFGIIFQRWGISVHSMELLGITSDILSQMKRQSVAERIRRGGIIDAEAHKESLRLKSEGEKQVDNYKALAQKEYSRKVSEGEAESTYIAAQAEADAMRAITNALAPDGVSQMSYFASQKYLELLSRVASTKNDCEDPYIMTYCPGVAGGFFQHLGKVVGRETSLSSMFVNDALSDGRAKLMPIFANAKDTATPTKDALPPLNQRNFDDLN